MKRYIMMLVAFFAIAMMISCASSGKVKKRSQPKRGPIPCPVKDC
jgi:hypothetical protein